MHFRGGDIWVGKPTGKPNGRPAIYTEELANEILKALGSCSQGLLTLCRKNPHWPCRTTIFTWMDDNPDFLSRYDIVKKKQVLSMMDEIIEIADDDRDDILIWTMEKSD